MQPAVLELFTIEYDFVICHIDIGQIVGVRDFMQLIICLREKRGDDFHHDAIHTPPRSRNDACKPWI
jgi:hypothetical protein